MQSLLIHGNEDCAHLRGGYHKPDPLIAPQVTRSKNKVLALLQSCKSAGANISQGALRDDKLGIRPVLHTSSLSHSWYLGPVLAPNRGLKVGQPTER